MLNLVCFIHGYDLDREETCKFDLTLISIESRFLICFCLGRFGYESRGWGGSSSQASSGHAAELLKSHIQTCWTLV